jgi:hypothetical protein
MNTKLTEEEAIRQVILEGTGGDFYDLAEVVKKRFGLLVSAGLIEEVYLKLQREVSPPLSADSDGSTLQHQPDDGSLARGDLNDMQLGSAFGSKQGRTLDFVRMMGGFGPARDAINDLEKSLKQLMK